MRLLVEIVIISALISLGWNTPFKESGSRAVTVIQRFVHSQLRTSSGVITIPAPTALRKTRESLGRTGVEEVSPAR